MKNLLLILVTSIVAASTSAHAVCTVKLLFDHKTQEYIGCQTSNNGTELNYSADKITEFGCGSYCSSIQKKHPDLDAEPVFKPAKTPIFCTATAQYGFVGNRYSGCTTTVKGHKASFDPASLSEEGCKTYCAAVQTEESTQKLQAFFKNNPNPGYSAILEACGNPEPGSYMDITEDSTGTHCISKKVGSVEVPTQEATTPQGRSRSGDSPPTKAGKAY